MSRPTPNAVRRARGWRPVRYLPEHRLVAALYGLGKSRDEIARATGYSPWHVSRITGMPEAKAEAERIAGALMRALTEQRVERFLEVLKGTNR
jgi:hypothetical protein